MPVSTAMYAIENGFDEAELKSELSDILLERAGKRIDEPLRTKFTEIDETKNGISCVIQFEVENKHSGWDGVEYGRERKQARIRFTDVFGEGAVLIIGKSEHQSEIASRLIDFFGIDPESPTVGDSESLGLIRVEISESELRSIIDDDAKIESRATYDSIDENTKSASLAGALGDSGPADRFNTRGEKRWVIFESKSFEMKVGITVKNNAAVFWGDWSPAEMERYWNRIIRNHIN